MSPLLVLVALSLSLQVGEGFSSFYYNKESLTDAFNQAFLRKHPKVARNVQQMFPNIENNQIFHLKKVIRSKTKLIQNRRFCFRRNQGKVNQLLQSQAFLGPNRLP